MLSNRVGWTLPLCLLLKFAVPPPLRLRAQFNYQMERFFASRRACKHRDVAAVAGRSTHNGTVALYS